MYNITLKLQFDMSPFAGSIASADIACEFWIDHKDLQRVATGMTPKPIDFQVDSNTGLSNGSSLNVHDKKTSLIILKSRSGWEKFDLKAGKDVIGEGLTSDVIDRKQREHRGLYRYNESRTVEGDPTLQSIETISGGTESTVDLTTIDIRSWEDAKDKKLTLAFKELEDSNSVSYIVEAYID